MFFKEHPKKNSWSRRWLFIILSNNLDRKDQAMPVKDPIRYANQNVLCNKRANRDFFFFFFSSK